MTHDHGTAARAGGHPAPSRLDEVHASMKEMATSMAGTSGLLEIGPWRDRDRSRVVGSRGGSGPDAPLSARYARAGRPPARPAIP